jgi:hypothetical protein
LSRPIEEELTHGGQVDATSGPLEERHPKLLLELADRLAERGLRDVQLLGGSAEVERLGDRNEVPQLTQVRTHRSNHRGSLSEVPSAGLITRRDQSRRQPVLDARAPFEEPQTVCRAPGERGHDEPQPPTRHVHEDSMSTGMVKHPRKNDDAMTAPSARAADAMTETLASFESGARNQQPNEPDRPTSERGWEVTVFAIATAVAPSARRR